MEEKNMADCGWVALKILLAKVYKNKELYLLVPDGRTDNLSMKEIIDYGRTYHVTMAGYETGDISDLRNARCPFIALVNMGGRSHYVVVGKVTHASVYISDEQLSDFPLPADVFEEVFLHKILLIGDVGAITAGQRVYAVPKVPHQRLSTGLFVLSLLLVLISLFFIDQNLSAGYAVIFLSAGFLIDFAHKQVLVALMRKFDTENIGYVEKIHDEEKLRAWTNLKKYYFSHNLTILTALVPVVLMSILLIINDWLYALLLIGLFTAVAVSSLINHRSEKKLYFRSPGNNLFTEKGLNLDAYDEMNRLSYRISRKYLFADYLEFGIIALGSILIMLYRGTNYLNYYLFHLMTLFYVTHQLKSLISYLFNGKKTFLAIAKFHQK